jgi:prepilin-type processing-associated H-X9-DG protein
VYLGSPPPRLGLEPEAVNMTFFDGNARRVSKG